jgi:cell division septum initiation protein DivIVA
MVTEGRWWGKAHVLYMKALSIDYSWIPQQAAAARSAGEQLDRAGRIVDAAELDACLEQLENAIATYRSQWVAYQFEVEKLRRELAAYERTLAQLPEVPEPPHASEQLLADVDRAVEAITAAAQDRYRR